jgi:D-sedoheptulose 7-phosphate isomerase
MSPLNVLKAAFQRHQELFAKSDAVLEGAARSAEILRKALDDGKKVLACGNGGSASDAEHFIGELLCRYKEDRKPLPGISLVSSAATLTAIGNDYGFEEVFARQVEALGKEGDVLVAFTTSGASKNVLAALKAAKKKKLRTVLLTGAKGASLAKEADAVVTVPSEETARIQEMHEFVYHCWCEFLDTN